MRWGGRFSGLFAAAAAVAASCISSWVVRGAEGYRYYYEWLGGAFDVLAVPALVLVFGGIVYRVARRAGDRIAVVTAFASGLLVAVALHLASVRGRWVEGYYVLPWGVKVKEMDSNALVSAWLDSRNVELSGSALWELRKRGASADDALMARIARWRAEYGSAYLGEGLVMEVAEILARNEDRRAIPVLLELAGAGDPACGMALDEEVRAYYRGEHKRILGILWGVYGVDYQGACGVKGIEKEVPTKAKAPTE